MNGITAERVRIDDIQREAVEQIDADRRASLGQFMTPSRVADFMASLFRRWPEETVLLEPSAGVGSLVDSFADEFARKAPPSSSLSVVCYEIETLLGENLANHLQAVEQRCRSAGYSIKTEIVLRDFIREGSFALSMGVPKYTHVILNPPYKKMGASSEYRLLLRNLGIESVNLYAAFLGLSVGLTKEGGEIVAIVPRSFCNGLYFRPFRKWLLDRVSISHIHVFESRKKTFSGDGVLQENVIIRLVRDQRREPVVISSSHDPSFSDYTERSVPHHEVVRPDDPELFVHVPVKQVRPVKNLFARTLADLGLEVSTGPVVDFRLRAHLTQEPTAETVPLLYAHHFHGAGLEWPKQHRKPNAIRRTLDTQKWLMRRGAYTVVKRFSAKEERRRIVAYALDPSNLEYEWYGFENHLNIIHARKQGIDLDLAQGLALFLNSTIVDEYFRMFSGHTQVNATDLRQIRFPSKDALTSLGRAVRGEGGLSQEDIDSRIMKIYG